MALPHLWLPLIWKSITTKLRNRSSKKAMARHPQSLRHALCTTEHGFNDHCINSRILGKNSIQLNWYLEKRKKAMAGLGIGVANMRSGERLLLHVGWELGYGKEGSFSFPNVPPMADLVYEVELIGFDDVKEGKA